MTEITLTPFTNVPYPEMTNEGIERDGSQYLSDLRELGIGQGDQVFRADSSGMWLGAKTFKDAPFSVSMAGAVTAYSLTIIGGTIKYGKTSFSDSSHDGYYIGAEGMYFGSVGDSTVVKHSISTGAITLKGAINTQSGSSIDAQYFIDSTITKTLTMGSASTTGIIQSYGWNGTANGFQIVGGSSPSISLIGGTITGGTLQTATTGSRVVISNSGVYGNKIVFYNGSDADPNGSIYASSVGLWISNPIAGGGVTIATVDGVSATFFGTFISAKSIVPVDSSQTLGTSSQMWNGVFTNGIRLPTATADIYGDMIPTSNSTYNIGASSYKWYNVYSTFATFDYLNQNLNANAYNITNIGQIIPGSGTAYLGNSSYYWDYFYVGTIYGSAGTGSIVLGNKLNANSKNIDNIQDCDINGSCDINSYCSIHDKLYMNNTQIKDVANPTSDQDAATKKWVTDNFAAK